MSPPRASRAGIIAAIARKDLTEYGRDRTWVAITIFGLAFMVVLFWLLPATTEETITVGVHAGGMEELSQQLAAADREGIRVVAFPSEEELKQAVAGELSDEAEAAIPGAKDVAIGIAFPADFLDAVAAGQKNTVTMYVDAAVPPELRTGITSFVREIAYEVAGRPLPVTQPEAQTIVLGVDRAGEQVSLREKMRPLLAFFVLLIESFALSSLIAAEVQDRTLTAILVTPARIGDILTAKGLVGTLLAVGQAVIFLAAARSFTGNVSALLVGIVLGGAMSAGVGMMAGSAGRDFIGTLFYGILFLVPMIIPAFAALFPGTASQWVKVFPSYGIVQTIVLATAYAEPWSVLVPYLLLAAGWCAVVFGGGLLLLRRKVVTL